MAAGAVSAAALLTAGCPIPDRAPAFAAPSPNPFGLTTVFSYSRPSLVDIDNDGDWTSLPVTFTETRYSSGTPARPSTPAFAAPAANQFGLGNTIWAATPCFIDIDHDGDLDAFIGKPKRRHSLFSKHRFRLSACFRPRPAPTHLI